MSVGRQSIFFSSDGPLADYFSEHPIIGWYFVSIKSPKSPKEAPKKTLMNSISGMFSSKPPSDTTLYHGPEVYYLFEKDTSHEEFREAGFRHVEIPISEIDLNDIIAIKDQPKIQTGGKRSHRKSRRSKKSRKSRKIRHH
jgi:hypothetical protein